MASTGELARAGRYALKALAAVSSSSLLHCGIDVRTAVDRVRRVKRVARWLAVGGLGVLVVGCGDEAGGTRPTPDAGSRCEGLCGCAQAGPPDITRAGSGMPAESSTDDQRAALQRANLWRTSAGLAPLNAHALLEQAATAHSEFMVGNASSCWPGAHNEVMSASCRGFTGAAPGARATAAGYRPAALGEVINWESTPAAAIDGWIWTVYHRFPFVNPDYTEVGFAAVPGTFSGRRTNFNTMEFARPSGEPTAVLTEPAVFPPPGQSDVPVLFRGNLEGPTPPLPATGRWPSGPVITVTFPSTEFELTVHKIYDVSCAEVPSSYFTARTSTDSNVRNLARRIAFFYPDEPLAASSEYTVEARGTVDGQPWSRVWRFTTAR